MAALSVVSHLDFATAVVKQTDQAEKILYRLEHLFHMYPKVRYWSFLGRYRGKAATAAERGGGGLAAGRDSDGAGIVQAWGEHTQDVVEIVLSLDGHRFSRCDMAVTILFDGPQPTAKELLDILPVDRYNYSIIQPGNDEGGTLYIGSRRSEVFARLYDKGAQLGTIPGRLLWRYEVEYKGLHAEKGIGALFGENVSPDGRQIAILGNVCAFFEEHEVPFPKVTPVVKGYPVIQYETRVTDDATTLRWLRTQVNPALERLRADGKLIDAIAALGIDELGNPVERFTPESMDRIQGNFFNCLQLPAWSNLQYE